MIGQLAARVDRADNECPRAARSRFRDGNVFDAKVGAAARQSQLPDNRSRTPVDDALAGFRRQRVLGVANEDQIGGIDCHDA